MVQPLSTENLRILIQQVQALAPQVHLLAQLSICHLANTESKEI